MTEESRTKLEDRLDADPATNPFMWVNGEPPRPGGLLASWPAGAWIDKPPTECQMAAKGV
jgi:hypothetical protein